MIFRNSDSALGGRIGQWEYGSASNHKFSQPYLGLFRISSEGIDQVIAELSANKPCSGYGFSIRTENKRPLVTQSFGTREDAEQARAEVASAVEKAIEVTPQG